MLIDIHMLQNYAPSNLNRDDTGAPKDAIFGNALRARISSQAIKRSIRRSEIFRDAFSSSALLANRTRELPHLLRQELEQTDLDPEAINLIVLRSREIGQESGREIAPSEATGDPQTAQLIFLANHEVSELAAKLVDLYHELGADRFGKLKSAEITASMGKSVPRSVDIAMFGRMTTSAAFEDVQAAVQVAHAISTHKVEQEFDYYTAVDDISLESGAGFIGDVAFNSATFYKYFSVHWEGLVKNLGNDPEVARQAIEALIQASAKVSPTGKQNTFAAHNLPDLILIEARERNLPVSYANAFLKPVWAGGNLFLMDQSVAALAAYMGHLNGVYEIPAQRAWLGTGDWELPNSARVPSLSALVSWLSLEVGQAG
jgi:CRISPR system Cascade subunit CasC